MKGFYQDFVAQLIIEIKEELFKDSFFN